METFGRWVPLAFNDGKGDNDVANNERVVVRPLISTMMVIMRMACNDSS